MHTGQFVITLHVVFDLTAVITEHCHVQRYYAAINVPLAWLYCSPFMDWVYKRWSLGLGHQSLVLETTWSLTLALLSTLKKATQNGTHVTH